MIKKIRDWTYQHAIPAAFIIFILVDCLLLGVGKLLELLPSSLPMKYLIEAVFIIIPIAIVIFFGFSRAFKNGKFFKGLICCIPLIIIQLIVLLLFFSENLDNPSVTWKSSSMIILGLISVVGIGIREECIYRATIQNVIAKKHANSVKGIWITTIVSSVIFGLCHVPNLLFGVAPAAVLSQTISATFAGLFFGAIYLRCGNIWVPILLHTLTDIASLAQSTFLVGISDVENISQYSISWLSTIFIILLYGGLTAFLLRPSKCKQIYENLCFADKKSAEQPTNE